MKERVKLGILLKTWESRMLALLLCSIILVAHIGVSAQERPGIRVEVDLVNLYMSLLRNTRGLPIEGLGAADFQVYEDDVEQQSGISARTMPRTRSVSFSTAVEAWRG